MQTPISTGSGLPGTDQRPGQHGSSTLQSGPSNSSPIVQSLAQIPSALHSSLQHSDASAHVLPFAVQGGAQTPSRQLLLQRIGVSSHHFQKSDKFVYVSG